eukprot:m.20263 g.20263  ORF g.20263 m.20263 type:complete len:78 (-) comp6790_c0_seq1:67-300(-)
MVPRQMGHLNESCACLKQVLRLSPDPGGVSSSFMVSKVFCKVKKPALFDFPTQLYVIFKRYCSVCGTTMDYIVKPKL